MKPLRDMTDRDTTAIVLVGFGLLVLTGVFERLFVLLSYFAIGIDPVRLTGTPTMQRWHYIVWPIAGTIAVVLGLILWFIPPRSQK